MSAPRANPVLTVTGSFSAGGVYVGLGSAVQPVEIAAAASIDINILYVLFGFIYSFLLYVALLFGHCVGQMRGIAQVDLYEICPGIGDGYGIASFGKHSVLTSEVMDIFPFPGSYPE